MTLTNHILFNVCGYQEPNWELDPPTKPTPDYVDEVKTELADARKEIHALRMLLATRPPLDAWKDTMGVQ